jgi:hypothetical protein
MLKECASIDAHGFPPNECCDIFDWCQDWRSNVSKERRAAVARREAPVNVAASVRFDCYVLYSYAS